MGYLCLKPLSGLWKLKKDAVDVASKILQAPSLSFGRYRENSIDRGTSHKRVTT